MGKKFQLQVFQVCDYFKSNLSTLQLIILHSFSVLITFLKQVALSTIYHKNGTAKCYFNNTQNLHWAPPLNLEHTFLQTPKSIDLNVMHVGKFAQRFSIVVELLTLLSSEYFRVVESGANSAPLVPVDYYITVYSQQLLLEASYSSTYTPRTLLLYSVH